MPEAKIIELFLPWPDKRLWPNNTVKQHWGATGRAAKIAKNTGFAVARQRYLPDGYAGKLELTLTFHPPSKRRWDEDNCKSALKHYMDGIFWGLKMDDSQITKSRSAKGHVLKGGGVKVELRQIDEAA